MNPTMSSTAAGSRITVYFPAGISLGRAESNAFCAATSASRRGSRFATSDEFAFCQPDESSASIVIDTSADVCVCHLLSPRELKIPSNDPRWKKLLRWSVCVCSATRQFFERHQLEARSDGSSLLKVPRRSLYSADALPGRARQLPSIRHRQHIRIRMLHPRQALRRLHHLPQTLIIKLVGVGSRRLSTECSAHRDHMIFLGHILVNGVIGKTSQRKTPAGEKDFHFIRS